MKTLSIFIDESGDFGEYAVHSPYYIISLVLHNQDIDISGSINWLEQALSDIGYPNHCVHTGPLIRGEEEYRLDDIELRKSVLRKMMSFLRRVNITYKSFHIEKKHIEDEVIAINKLSKQLGGCGRNYIFILTFTMNKPAALNCESQSENISSLLRELRIA